MFASVDVSVDEPRGGDDPTIAMLPEQKRNVTRGDTASSVANAPVRCDDLSRRRRADERQVVGRAG